MIGMIKNVGRRNGGWLLGLLLLWGCSGKETPPLRLYAGAGLRPAVEAVCAAFERQTGIAVDVDYAGSGILLARVQDDPHADLFLPADEWYIGRLRELAGSVVDDVPVARLIPVLMVAPGNPLHLEGVSDLTRAEITTAMGNPQACQVGRICQRMLERSNLAWANVVDQEALTVNELSLWVQMKAVDAAVVWDSIARAAVPRAQLVALDLEPDEISRVNCARLRTSANPDAARALMQFFSGSVGQQILQQNGYSGVGE